MLVELSKRVVEQLERQKLAKAKDADADHINKTNEALKAFLSEIEALQRRIRLIGNRLAPVIVQSAENEASKLGGELMQSRRNFFNGNYKQEDKIRRLESTLKEQDKKLAQNWQYHASKPLSGYKAAIGLLQFSTSDKEYKDSVAQLYTRLAQYSERVPANEKELAEYDFIVKSLEAKLKDVQGVSTEVDVFLTKLKQGTATVADLQGEVLVWCQDTSRAKAFKITFDS